MEPLSPLNINSRNQSAPGVNAPNTGRPPMQSPMQAQQMPPAHDRKIGPIVGVVIIIILLILAALYFWSAKLNNSGSTDLPVTPATQTQSGQSMTMPDGSTMSTESSSAPVDVTPTPTEQKVDKDLGLDELNTINTKTDF